jgi:hypothetical protein
MPQRLDPKFDVLPAAQQQIWNDLPAAPRLGFVLYGGTAIALHLEHRQSIDFDFFGPSHSTSIGCARSLRSWGKPPCCKTPLTRWWYSPKCRPVWWKFRFSAASVSGRVNDPLLTRDGVLLIASLDDLMATKLKATLDRAEAKDYRDIAELILAGESLSVGLSAFRQMFNGEPAQVLRAIGSRTEI